MSTYYIKKGRRYVPVRESETGGAMPLGDYIVRVLPGCTTWTRVETPARPELLVAIEEAREAMITAMREANVFRPEQEPLTPKELEAYKAFFKAMGGPVVFRGASMYDIIDAGIKVLRAGVAQR